MYLFTIGYTKKSVEKFFELVNISHINILVDVRLYNPTQLAGFSKSNDLKYFLKQICNCNYIALQEFTLNRSLFNNYKKGYIGWNEYKRIYNAFLNTRANLDFFLPFKTNEFVFFVQKILQSIVIIVYLKKRLSTHMTM